jgi:hypothetical protein
MELQPNKVLSKIMRVTPLKGVAIYRLIKSDEISPTATDINGNKKFSNPSWKSADKFQIRDIETGQMVLIGNVVSVKAVKEPNGALRYDPVTAALKFTDGTLRITDKEQATYEAAERHNANRDNPFRDDSKPAIYYRIDARKYAASQNNKNAILAESLMWVTNLDHIKIKALNQDLPDGKKLNLDSEYEVIKDQLFKLTQEDPIMVMKASDNRATIAKIVVMECERFQIILWDNEKRVWFFNDEKQLTIMEVEIGKNRIDALAEFGKTDDEGRKFFIKMQQRLSKFLNKGAPE